MVTIILQEDIKTDTDVDMVFVIILKLQMHSQAFTLNKLQELMLHLRFPQQLTLITPLLLLIKHMLYNQSLIKEVRKIANSYTTMLLTVIQFILMR